MEITFDVLLFMVILIINGPVIVPSQHVKLVTVLFRHGDRTPDERSLYPLDPHINETYYPVGLGQLTSKGKQREYALGQLLRKRYDSFLGDVYTPGILEAVSTNSDRTKASLQLVFAGLFPPRVTDLNWNPVLDWQPIPYDYTSFTQDMWMTYSYSNCPRYAKLFNEYSASDAGLEFAKMNVILYNYLQSKTGLNMTDPIVVWGLYSCLQSQEEWGLKLPQWTDGIYPDVLEKATVDVMRRHVVTSELRQLSGGCFMLKKIITNMLAKVNNTLSPQEKKLILYSAHDLNILYLAAVLDQNITQTIPYGSYYIIELVEMDGSDKVQIFQNDYVTQNVSAVRIPWCELQCPLKDFVKLLDRYIPVNDDACFTN